MFGANTMDRRIATATMLVACATLFLPDVLAAQNPKKPKGGRKAKEEVHGTPIDGTIRQISPQGVFVETGGGDKFMIALNRDTQVSLHGQVSPEMLASGAFVEFEVELDRAGAPATELKAITLVDYSPINIAGLFPTSVEAGEDNSASGAHASFLARGRVASHRNGVLIVQTGQKTVIAKVADDVALSARLDSWALAAAGDAISGTVELVPQVNTGVSHVIGKQLSIQAARPIQPLKSRREAPRARTPTAQAAPAYPSAERAAAAEPR